MSTRTATVTRTTTAVQEPSPPAPPPRGSVHVVTLGVLVFLFWFLPDDTLSELEPKTELGTLAFSLFDPPRLLLSYLVLFFCWKTLGTIISGMAWASANNGITFFSFDPFSAASSRPEDINTSFEDLGNALHVRGRPVAEGVILAIGALAFLGGFLLQLLAIGAFVLSAVFMALEYLWISVGLGELFSLPVPVGQWVLLLFIVLISCRFILIGCLLWPRPSQKKAERLIAARKARKLKRLEKPLRLLVEAAREAEKKAKGYEDKKAAWAEYNAFCDDHGVVMSKTFEIRWKDGDGN